MNDLVDGVDNDWCQLLSFLDRFFWSSWLLFIHVIDLFLTTQHDDLFEETAR